MLSLGWESPSRVSSFPAQLTWAFLVVSWEVLGPCPAVPGGVSGKVFWLFLLGRDAKFYEADDWAIFAVTKEEIKVLEV